MSTGITMAKEEKLFGLPKWNVEQAADTLGKAQELELDSDLYNAAIKLLKRRQNTIGSVLRAARRVKEIR